MIEPRCLSDGEARPPLFHELFVGWRNGFVGTRASGRGAVRAPRVLQMNNTVW
ncbi:hypothetical protein V1289_001712 [Bradyrhizobium sp. AZCC 2289]